MRQKKWTVTFLAGAIALSDGLLFGVHNISAQIPANQRQLDPLRRCNYGRNNELKPYGDIGASWQALGGEQSPLGCPITPEINTTDGPGRIQSFQFGQMSWSGPKGLGNHPVLIAYQAGNAIEVIWAGTQPFNYDFWIVRTDSNGVNLEQKDIKTTRVDGWYVYRNTVPGQNYSFIVEGCDEVGILGEGGQAECRQGWMNRVAVTTQANNPKKTSATLPDPPKRGESCFINPKCIADVVKEAASVVSAVAKAIAAL
ncbi:MAG: hypothetical protein RMY34_35760 [Aulosira sp. DedQUE10]|nr:hypothetical protein [Aulosira sp. DedQUE10]